MIKTAAKIILLLIVALNLLGCVVTVNNNFGSDIHTSKLVDDIAVGQEYDTNLDMKEKRK